MTQDHSAALATITLLIDAGDLVKAEAIGRDLHARNPRDATALHVLGLIARRTGRIELALKLLEQAVSLDRANPGLQFELATALSDALRLEEALAGFRRAAELHPGFQEAQVNGAAILERLDRPEDALPLSRRAVELQPDCRLARFNLANVLRSLGNLDEASAELQTALRLDPEFAQAHWNHACCRLLAGDYSAGWAEYEWRARAGEVSIDSYPQPRWQGESLADKTILVHAEQGIGDEILFASCLPELIAAAKRCVVICEPRLAPMFARSFPAAHICAFARRKDRQPAAPPEPVDVQIPAGSVPLYLRPTTASFPQRKRFLLADPVRRNVWRQRYAALGPGLKIGISWRAGGQPSEHRKRTTSLDHWKDIFATTGVHFVNLQYGDTAAEIAAAREQWGVTIHDWPDCDPLVDLDGFAAKVAALDLVISVGNATVHMAGALGTPAWALLPKTPAWRWMIAGDQSPWYPSVKLWRQTERGVWAPVFEQAAEKLRELLEAREKENDAAANKSATKQGAASNPSPFGRGQGEGPPPSRSSLPSAASGQANNGDERSQALGVHAAQPALTPALSQREREHAQTPPATAGRFTTLADVHAAFERAAQRFQTGDVAGAETLCQEILEHAPRNASALQLLAAIARKTDRLEMAVRLLTRAAAVLEQDPAVHLQLADALQQAGRLEEAIASYRRAIQIKPDAALPHLSLGNALRGRGQLTVAAESYRQAIAAEPDFEKPYNALGAVLLELSRPADAETPLRQAVKLKPDYQFAHNNLGRCLQLQGRVEEAIRAFQRALELDENCFQAILNLACVFSDQRQWETAARFYRRALKLRPQCAEAWHGLAVALQEKGVLAEAVRCYDEALQIEPRMHAAAAGRATAQRLLASQPQAHFSQPHAEPASSR